MGTLNAGGINPQITHRHVVFIKVKKEKSHALHRTVPHNRDLDLI